MKGTIAWPKSRAGKPGIPLAILLSAFNGRTVLSFFKNALALTS
jgi:hypothetical protein